MELSPVIVIGLALTFMSLLIDYAPKISTWFDVLQLGQKRAIILGICVAIVFGVTGLDCAGFLETAIECSPFDWQFLVTLIFKIVASVAGMTAFHDGSKPSTE